MDQLENEYRILCTLSDLEGCCYNIIRAYEFERGDGHAILTMPYGGKAVTCVVQERRISQDEVKMIFDQIRDACQFLHGQYIVHRDVKLDNVLLDARSGDVRIIDFGMAMRLSGEQIGLPVLCGEIGSPPYMAPELFSGNRYRGIPVDMRAAAICLFGLLTCHVPWDKAVRENSRYLHFLRGNAEDACSLFRNTPHSQGVDWEHMPRWACTTLNSLLHVDPAQRSW